MFSKIRAENVVLKQAALPDIPPPDIYPALPATVYRARLKRLRNRMELEGFCSLIIYADREHAANFAWLTGFEPRFEEAFALVTLDREKPDAFLGNESLSLAELTPVPLNPVHWPPLSLISQPRKGTRPLRDLLGQAGLKAGPIGVAGWKIFGPDEFEYPEHTFETPHWLIENIRIIAGGLANVVNATPWFMSPLDGLRTSIEPEEAARMEYAAAWASSGLARLLDRLEPGKSELELAESLNSRGLPLSCHPMVSTGPKARFGLSSPSSNVVQLGDPFTSAFGICGGLSCRAGYVARSTDDLPPQHRHWLDAVARPFFAAVASWYQAMGIGLTGGKLYKMVESCLPQARFGWSLNPGHLIAMDEWVSSPVFPGSNIPFRSGMAVQMDIIPVPADGSCGGNVEDGILLADQSYRARLARKFPDMWARIQARRHFMIHVLGIPLDESVLPLSCIPAYWTPLLLHRPVAFAIRR